MRPLILRKGDLALFDTFSGMIPCRVLDIKGTPGLASTAQVVTIALTATRGAYKRGERVESTGLHVCPRRSVTVNQYIRQYTVEI